MKKTLKFGLLLLATLGMFVACKNAAEEEAPAPMPVGAPSISADRAAGTEALKPAEYPFALGEKANTDDPTNIESWGKYATADGNAEIYLFNDGTGYYVFKKSIDSGSTRAALGNDDADQSGSQGKIAWAANSSYISVQTKAEIPSALRVSKDSDGKTVLNGKIETSFATLFVKDATLDFTFPDKIKLELSESTDVTDNEETADLVRKAGYWVPTVIDNDGSKVTATVVYYDAHEELHATTTTDTRKVIPDVDETEYEVTWNGDGDSPGFGEFDTNDDDYAFAPENTKLIINYAPLDGDSRASKYALSGYIIADESDQRFYTTIGGKEIVYNVTVTP